MSLKNIIKDINLALFIFITSLIIYIVRCHLVMLDGKVTQFWGSFINLDFYSYYKMIFFLTASFFLLITFLKYVDLNGIKKTNYYIPAAVYSIFAVLSSFKAEYKEIVIKGFPDRYENIFVLLGYLLLVVVAVNIVDNKKSVSYTHLTLPTNREV